MMGTSISIIGIENNCQCPLEIVMVLNSNGQETITCVLRVLPLYRSVSSNYALH